MFPINDDSISSDSGIVKELRNYGDNSSSIIIHEHDFVIRAKEQEEKEERKSIICVTCGSLYCESCGKLLGTLYDKNYMQHNHSNNLYN